MQDSIMIPPEELVARRVERAARHESFMYETYIERRIAEIKIQMECLNARANVLADYKKRLQY